ncbi:hypothetical protein [Nocardia anaemiae]|uniref:hypothetical protein n=1 Tax=Nocardia anaemiae TaxID=263910 RepID=UPI0007A39D7D|nr:hypothetical protein [Nocardia anaemiae]
MGEHGEVFSRIANEMSDADLTEFCEHMRSQTKPASKFTALTFAGIQMVIEANVEDGAIEIGDRPVAEIVTELESNLASIGDSSAVSIVLDHRQTLLDRARSEAKAGYSHVAVTLYATWVEHHVNSLLRMKLEWANYSRETIVSLLRELRLRTKLTALWEVADLRPISDDLIAVIDRISEDRNRFVHYKWSSFTSAEDYADEARREGILAKAEGLVSALSDLESETIWNGRRDEIFAAFWLSYIDRWHGEAGLAAIKRMARPA